MPRIPVEAIRMERKKSASERVPYRYTPKTSRKDSSAKKEIPLNLIPLLFLFLFSKEALAHSNHPSGQLENSVTQYLRIVPQKPSSNTKKMENGIAFTRLFYSPILSHDSMCETWGCRRKFWHNPMLNFKF